MPKEPHHEHAVMGAPTATDEDEMALINEKEAAAQCGLAVRTLQNWRTRGEGPTFYKMGRAVRYSSDEIAQWVEQQRASSTSAVAAPV